MRELISLQCFPNFRAAAEHAKALAIESQSQTGVRRSGSGWSVLASPSVARLEPILSDDCREDLYDAEEGGYEAEDEYQREVIEPLLEELEEDREDYARSEEEGWFYGDE